MSSPREPRPDAVAAKSLAAEPVAAESVAERKRQARADIRRGRRTRAAWPQGDPRRLAEERAVAAAVLPHVPEDPAAGAPPVTVASYEALPTEPPTTALNAALRDRGVRVIVPVLLPDKDLDWVAWGGDPDAARLGTAAIGAAHLVVVPALAVDRRGRRLGQGGGSYDRALARRGPAAVTVAVVDDNGLLDEVPHEAHDAAVDAVVRPGHGWTDLSGDVLFCEDRLDREDWPPDRAARA